MHSKGWMDKSKMKTWFDKVWKKKPEGNRINKKKAFFIMNSFKGYKTNIIKNIVSNINTDLAIVLFLLFNHFIFVLISYLKIDFVKNEMLRWV